MFATRGHFAIRIGLVVLTGAAAASLGGCADLARVTSLSSIPLDENSAVAEKVRQATQDHPGRPRFRDVPPKPTDVPPPGAFKTAVAQTQKGGAQLEAWVAANPPMIPADPTQTEAFAESQRARIPAGEMIPPAPVGSEDYAARLRDLATPPPPPK